MSDDPTVDARLKRGEIVAVGRGLYRLCGDCGSVVRINKPLVGALHLCLTDEERAYQRQLRTSQLAANQRFAAFPAVVAPSPREETPDD